MTKVSLSRKGFDSSAGGRGSPVIDYRYMSLPIPEAGSGLFYSQLRLDGDSYDFLTILRQLGAKQYSECHMDPNLNPELYGLRREEGWEPAFGQDGNAASQLRTNGFKSGDIFLFFGKFRQARMKNERFEWSDKKYFHAIYGFLEVGEIIKIDTQLSHEHLKLYGSHPHVAKRNSVLYSDRSTLFIPARQSTHGFKKTYGIFKFHKNLVLTRDDSDLTNWRLPTPFHRKHFGTIGTIDRYGNVSARGRGQEFIGNADKLLIDWVRLMIQSHT